MTSFGILLFAAVNLTAADAVVGLDRTHFNIGTYYVKPEFRTEATFRKMKDAGFDYVIDAFHPRDLQTHDIMKRAGIKAVLLRRCPHCWGGKVDEIGRQETIAPISAYEAGVLSLKPEEGEAMMAIADEISADDFPHYVRVVGPNGAVRPDRTKDGAYSIALRSNGCAFIVGMQSE